MCWGSGTKLFPLLMISITLLSVQFELTDGQSSHVYMYSRFSCNDLAPKHEMEINKIREQELQDLRKLTMQKDKDKNHVEEPKKKALTQAELEILDISAMKLIARNSAAAKSAKMKGKDQEEEDLPKAMHYTSLSEQEANHETEDQTFDNLEKPQNAPLRQFLPRQLSKENENESGNSTTETSDARTTTVPRLSQQKKPESAAQKLEKSTTTMMTTTTTMPPPASMGSGGSPVTILTSEDKYRRLKHLTVTLQSTEYFEGFMLQARQLLGSGKIKAVGRFIEPPRQAREITCPTGYQRDNTVLDRQRPVLLKNLSFSWVAPDTDRGSVEFVGSVSINSGAVYYTTTSQPLSLSYFPVSTKDCARSKSCYRLCPRDHRYCPGYAALYMATLTLANNNKTITITLGGTLLNNDSYVAIGLTNDRERLSNSDLSVCYRRQDTRGVGLSHYLLEDLDAMPERHQGKLRLIREDSDADQVWCSFTRPVKGNELTSLNLDIPKYLFYFHGVMNGSDLYVPASKRIRRSLSRLTATDDYFNEISYENGSVRTTDTPATTIVKIIAVSLLVVLTGFFPL